MKKLNVFGLVVALGFMGFTSLSASPAQAADRCSGLVPDNLIQAESVQDMYFDMRMSELMCHYLTKDQALLNKIAASIGSFKNRYSSCIVAAQNKLISNLGSEGTFDNFYATLGNQMVLLQELSPADKPCDRALKLAAALMKKKMSCGTDLTGTYAPWFQGLDKEYNAKTQKLLHRVCDKTDS